MSNETPIEKDDAGIVIGVPVVPVVVKNYPNVIVNDTIRTTITNIPSVDIPNVVNVAYAKQVIHLEDKDLPWVNNKAKAFEVHARIPGGPYGGSLVIGNAGRISFSSGGVGATFYPTVRDCYTVPVIFPGESIYKDSQTSGFNIFLVEK